jgi:signal peptidase I
VTLPRKTRKDGVTLGLLLGLFVMVLPVSLYLFFQRYMIMVTQGEGMSPTLGDRSRHLFRKGQYQPKRGDIIGFAYRGENAEWLREMYGEDYDVPDRLNGCDFIKRVVAVGGDTIEIRNNRVYLNGTELDEPYVKYEHHMRDYGPYTVPADSVFVLGDNRDATWDSRDFGPVKVEKIFGKMLFVR